MIRYALRCDRAHRFDVLVRIERGLRPAATTAGLVSCAVCGSGTVAKDLMAPAIGAPAPERRAPRAPPRRPSRRWPSSAAASRPVRGRRPRLRRRGRRIHEGVAPERSIIGEAHPRRGPRPGRGRHPGGPPALALRQVELTSNRPVCHRRPAPEPSDIISQAPSPPATLRPRPRRRHRPRLRPPRGRDRARPPSPRPGRSRSPAPRANALGNSRRLRDPGRSHLQQVQEGIEGIHRRVSARSRLDHPQKPGTDKAT